jgi:hypothetical protein
MCILNGIQIWPKDAILHIFQGNPRELPPISMHPRGATNVCLNKYYMMHMKRGSQQLREKELYVLSAKTRQSSLANQNIRFCQQNRTLRFGKLNLRFFPDKHINKKQTPIDFMHSYIHM